jgi:hypothetical protein
MRLPRGWAECKGSSCSPLSHRGTASHRTLFAFDPRRVAILLIGGDKTGNARWYEEFVPRADNIYAEHLKAIEKER